jgi:hypothetical protein
MQPTKIREFDALDTSGDTITVEEWQGWVAPGDPGLKFFCLPTGMHVNKMPGKKGLYEVVQTGEELIANDANEP